MQQNHDKFRGWVTIPKIVLLASLLLTGCDKKVKSNGNSAVETTKQESLPSSVPVQNNAPKMIEPAKSTYTIRLDSSAWVYYYFPWDSTLATDSLFLFPDGSYLISRNTYSYYDDGEDRVRGKYTTNGDTLILSQPAGGYGYQFPRLFISDSSLRHIRTKYGPPLPPDLHNIQFNSEEVKQRRIQFSGHLANFLSNSELIALNTKVGTIEQLNEIYGEPKNVSQIAVLPGSGELNGMRLVVEYDSLTIHFNKTTIWVYEYSNNKYQLKYSHIGIGTPKNDVHNYLGRPTFNIDGMEGYDSRYAKEFIHEYDTGNPSEPVWPREVQYTVLFEYDDKNSTITRVRWSLSEVQLGE